MDIVNVWLPDASSVSSSIEITKKASASLKCRPMIVLLAEVEEEFDVLTDTVVSVDALEFDMLEVSDAEELLDPVELASVGSLDGGVGSDDEEFEAKDEYLRQKLWNWLKSPELLELELKLKELKLGTVWT